MRGFVLTLFIRPCVDGLRYLATLVDAGQLQPVLDGSYPFDWIAEAFAALEQGHTRERSSSPSCSWPGESYTRPSASMSSRNCWWTSSLTVVRVSAIASR
ncbi:MAG: zinc-binding dehydrogenase [Arthrobacter sp.]